MGDAATLAATWRPEVEQVFARLRAEGAKWGVGLDALRFEAARFALQPDPISGEAALIARWSLDGRGGQLTLRPDGYAYAECDLLTDHPRKPSCWIEAVATWGLLPELRSEPRLLEKPR